MGFKFKKDVNLGRKLRHVDRDGDKITVSHDRNSVKGDYPFIFAIGHRGQHSTAGVVGLKRKQAVKLAHAILEEAAQHG